MWYKVKYEHFTGLTVWRSGHSVPEIPHAISMQAYSFDCLIQHAIYFRVTEKGDDGLVRRVLAPRRCRCISLLPITEENMAAANPFVLSLFSVVIMFSCKILFIVRMGFTNSCSCLRWNTCVLDVWFLYLRLISPCNQFILPLPLSLMCFFIFHGILKQCILYPYM